MIFGKIWNNYQLVVVVLVAAVLVAAVLVVKGEGDGKIKERKK